MYIYAFMVRGSSLLCGEERPHSCTVKPSPSIATTSASQYSEVLAYLALTLSPTAIGLHFWPKRTGALGARVVPRGTAHAWCRLPWEQSLFGNANVAGPFMGTFLTVSFCYRCGGKNGVKKKKTFSLRVLEALKSAGSSHAPLMHIYINAYMHACIHTYIYMNIHTHIHLVCLRVNMHLYACI